MEDWNPLYDKIIVRRDPAPAEIRGLAVPEQAKKAQTAGTVQKVGIGRIDVGAGRATALTVRPGDRVLFSPFSGQPLDPEEPDLVVLREDELLAYCRGGDGPFQEPLEPQA